MIVSEGLARMEGKPAKREGRKPTLNGALGGKCVRTDFSVAGHGGKILSGSVDVRRCMVDFVALIIFELGVMLYSGMSETSHVLDLHCCRPRIGHLAERCCITVVRDVSESVVCFFVLHSDLPNVHVSEF